MDTTPSYLFHLKHWSSGAVWVIHLQAYTEGQATMLAERICAVFDMGIYLVEPVPPDQPAPVQAPWPFTPAQYKPEQQGDDYFAFPLPADPTKT